MAGAVLGPTCDKLSLVRFSGASVSCSNSGYFQYVYSSHNRPSSVCFRTASASSCLLRSGLSHQSSWSGRSHLGECQIYRVLTGRQPLSKLFVTGRVHASLLGVGAPEALVIAVVALLVFGPKGLAEVARTIGKSLKAFQPTIQELQVFGVITEPHTPTEQVSREFRSTLEQEIGLDELRNPKPLETPPPLQSELPTPVLTPKEDEQPFERTPQRDEPLLAQRTPEGKAYKTDDYVRATTDGGKGLVPEDMRREAELAAWGGTTPTKSAGNLEIGGPKGDESKKNEEL